MKKYFINRINNFTEYLPEEDIWEKAILLKDFSYPWRDEEPKETYFRALYDDNYLYLRYDVKDEDILIYTKTGKKLDIIQSDRVEIFFRINSQLDHYYCLEIDPRGKVLDYSASYYREFDFSWTWPKKHLFVKGSLSLEGYRVDIKISIESLKKLNLLHNNVLEAGIYRGDCIALPNDNMEEADIKWISWVNPKTKNPDFHIPSSFGVLEFIEDKN